ncbi:MAG TPA: STAS domain-containing protein [Candidatus Sulfotelmatobacter sp.]|jgi:anti-sigma B factor antagonist|nr:STAS domain-containing protein [Candidatus Sulfotelmatobacter sp.]
MQLRLESRPVGDVLIVQCHGRIVAGNEVFTLHSHVGDSIQKHGDVVLQLDHVEFVDSSGLGALVRLMQAARSKGGDLKLTGLPPNVRKMLQLTSLLSQFETYDSVEEAITAAYLGSRYSRGKAGDARPRLLCVFESTDVCTFLREVLCSAGYNAMTTLSINDARILLKATKAKLVIVSARMQTIHSKTTSKILEEIDPTVSVLILDENFATQDPGEAAEKLLSSVSSRLAVSN